MYVKTTADMKSWFLNRGYNEKLLNRQVDRARSKTRRETLQPKPISRSEEGYVPLVLDFHPALSKVSSILSELQPILSNCSATSVIFPDNPFLSYRRTRNLKNSLVRTKLPSVNNLELTGMCPCGKTRCQICKFIMGGRTFSDSFSKQEFYINYRFDCDSVGVVYLLSCKKCNKQYVGNTTTSFRKRFNNHKSSLQRYGRGQRGIPGEYLYAHFFSNGHGGLSDLSATIIDKTNVNNPTEREGFWTYKLNTLIPMGLNTCDFF